jgi:DUF1680 family protein
MADIAALTGDEKYLQSVDRIWENMVSKKFYVQGGLGAIPHGERFGDNYELPNTTAYNETCAAIANVYWNHRMFLLHGDSKYIDVLEKSLYNGLISGVGMDGKSFFYTNAMQIKNSFSHSAMEPERSGWFDCSCCPTNVARLIPSIPGYTYAQNDDDVYVNLFVNSTASINVHGKPVTIMQQNNYPWDGALKFTVSPKSSDAFNLLVRIPGWAQNQAVPSDLYSFASESAKKAEIKINGQPVDYNIEKGYAVLKRKWKKGDVVELNLPMEVRRVVANEKVKDDIGKVALQYGPLMYCAEWPDNDGKASNFIMPASAIFTTEFKPGLLNGVRVLKTEVPAVVIDANGDNVSTVKKSFTAIPYYAWANRGKGEMMLWFPTKITDVDLLASDSNNAIRGK